jgi:hypothetical protein
MLLTKESLGRATLEKEKHGIGPIGNKIMRTVDSNRIIIPRNNKKMFRQRAGHLPVM